MMKITRMTCVGPEEWYLGPAQRTLYTSDPDEFAALHGRFPCVMVPVMDGNGIRVETTPGTREPDAMSAWLRDGRETA